MKHPLAADVVGDPATEQQQGAERQRVGGDDPLPVGVADAEVRLRRGSAMFTIVASSTTISWAMASTASAHHRPGRAGGPGDTGGDTS